MDNSSIKLIECPRDAMQGWPHIIPTEEKIRYINALLAAGFDTIDFGSFVSAKAIPQMSDTGLVIEGLDNNAKTKLLAIIANQRGAEEVIMHEKISFLGYPFSISETFQIRNTNASIASSFETVKEIQELCLKNNKQLVVYISMAFGNPYGDHYNQELVLDWINKIAGLNIGVISIADTVGIATPDQVSSVLTNVITSFPETEIGVHLHSTPLGRIEKLDAAIEAGCRRFDGAIKGIGGCPMSGNALIGNMDTEFMVMHLEKKGFNTGVGHQQLKQCSQIASSIFL